MNRIMIISGLLSVLGFGGMSAMDSKPVVETPPVVAVETAPAILQGDSTNKSASSAGAQQDMMFAFEMQTMIEGTLKAMDYVDDATVVIAIPEKSGDEYYVSVSLEGEIPEDNAVRGKVQTFLPGVKDGNISVVDSFGNVH